MKFSKILSLASWLPSCSGWLILFIYLIRAVSSFNVETRTNKAITGPPVEGGSNIRSSHFGQSFLIDPPGSGNEGGKFLIGSPKTRSPTDGPTGTAPYLKPQFDEKYASGTLYSCPVNFDPKPSQCSPARPESSPGSNNFNNRDAYGLSLSGGKDEKQIAVCTPNQGKNCSGAYYTVGKCQRSTNFGSNWENPLPGADPKCGVGTTDLIFIIDSSFSVGFANFITIKHWITNVVRSFNLSTTFHVGVVVYSLRSNLNFEDVYVAKTPIALGEFRTQSSFQNGVNAIRYGQGKTYTAQAINTALDHFEASPRFHDPGNRKISIILTDGETNDEDKENLLPAAERAKDLGVTLFAVGVGRYDRSELLSITGTKDRVFEVRAFRELQTIVTTVQKSIVFLEGTSGGVENNKLSQAQTGFSLLHGGVSRDPCSCFCFDYSFLPFVPHVVTSVYF